MEIKISPQYEQYLSGVNYGKMYDESGQEHYRLLAYLSTLFDHQEIFDLGTQTGTSAYALAYNPNNLIHTFDIVDQVINHVIKNRDNIKFHICDLFTEEGRQIWLSRLLAAPLIFLDVDPHNGVMEYAFYQMLCQHGYKGLLVCDDIWFFKEMRDRFWSQIPDDQKYDLTPFGHWSGTGVITFNHLYDHLFPKKTETSGWTLVTAYIDLTHCQDMNQSVRSKEYYLEHANATMSCPYNLVVYCDQNSLEQLKKLRPTHLMDRTRYVVVDFDQLKFVGHQGYDDVTFEEYRRRITENRIKKPYLFDPRNNASYYLFCMARCLLLKQTIEENPFNSTHFAWINICIERMGYKNLIHLDEALSANRDKFSTCYIDYIPKSLIDQTHEYFRMGRCSMCSGFFTGHKKFMAPVCHAIESKFLEYLEQGYGHADEQLYSPVYFESPELFEHYYGDYKEMITNYCYIYEHAEAPIKIFIRNSYNYQNYDKCHEACRYVWNSYVKGKCHLTEEELKELCFYDKISQRRKEQQGFSPSCLGDLPDKIQACLDQHMYEEAQRLIDKIDYRHDETSLYTFVNYSILTNYYTMVDHQLNPIVKRIIEDPENVEIRRIIKERHGANLSFYK